MKPSNYNPRKIDDNELKKLEDSIREFDCVEPIVVNKDFTVIGGHQRLRAAINLGHEQIPIIQIDIPKNKEKALNLALNRITGQWDNSKLIVALQDLINSEVDEALSGFDQTEIDIILKNFEEGNNWEEEYQGMPEFENEDQTSFKQIKVHFANKNDLNNFAKLIGQKLTLKIRSIWFPRAEIESLANTKYVDEKRNNGA